MQKRRKYASLWSTFPLPVTGMVLLKAALGAGGWRLPVHRHCTVLLLRIGHVRNWSGCERMLYFYFRF